MMTRSLHEVLGHAGDGILIADSEDNVTYVNDTAEHILGVMPGDLLGQPICKVLPFLATGSSAGTMRRPDGKLAMVEISIGACDDASGVAGSIYIARDLAKRQAHEEFDALANHDIATGLWNRRYLLRELATRLAAARRYHFHGALVLIDLDPLRGVVERCGHVVSDLLLQHIAKLVRENIRASDLAARMTATKLGILLDHTTTASALQCANKIQGLLASVELPAGGALEHMSVAIGIAEFPRRKQTPELIFASASAALYRAGHAEVAAR